MRLIGIVIEWLVNPFAPCTALRFVVFVTGALVLTGLTAYDTQRLKGIYIGDDDDQITGKKAIMGAPVLNLEFLSLFLTLMRLFGTQSNFTRPVRVVD